MREALSDTAEMVEGEDASLTKMIETLLEGQPVTLTLTLMPPTPTPNPNPNPFPTSTTSNATHHVLMCPYFASVAARVLGSHHSFVGQFFMLS